MVLMGTGMDSSSTRSSSSCVPSSAIVVCGREPGRGKKTERLRECSREWRRVCLGGDVDGGPVVVDDDIGVVGEAEASGAEWDVESMGGAGKGCAGGECKGKEVESGDGNGGENGVEVDRVREWE